MYIMSKEIQEDFLEADDSIRGQNFACLSFISPENVLANKEIYKQQHFLRHLVKSNNINLSQEFINDLENKFKDFLYTNEVNLEKLNIDIKYHTTISDYEKVLGESYATA